METVTSTIQLPEAILTDILARLPLRIISRFKSVSKTWKSTLESVYFRRLFVSLHRNSPPAWSLISREGKELLGFHGCETWDLPKSLASYIPLSLQTYGFQRSASSNGLVLLERFDADYCFCYVGNPVLQQWVKIPPTNNHSYMVGLVTRVDEDGVVLDFKVVRASLKTSDNISCTLSMCIYSSETGVWTSKIVHCSTLVSFLRTESLNGAVYFKCRDDLLKSEVLVSHDLYSESDQCRVVPFPLDDNYFDDDVLTTSGGFIMYISRILPKTGGTIFKIWRLNNDESWQLLWEKHITRQCLLPVAMHPFNSDIVYLWCFRNCHLVQCNLRTQKERILRDEDNDENQDYFMSDSFDEGYDDIRTWTPPRWLFQFVSPRWMESMPRPPQAEMIDTASLLSYLSDEDEQRIQSMTEPTMQWRPSSPSFFSSRKRRDKRGGLRKSKRHRNTSSANHNGKQICHRGRGCGVLN